MDIRKLDITAMQMLYDSAMTKHFPFAELKSKERLTILMEQEVYEAYGAYVEDELVAYACFCGVSDDYWLLDYYAVFKEYRGQQIGSDVLRSFAERLPIAGLILEVESVLPELPEDVKHTRERRIRFYERLGAQDTEIKSFLLGVDFDILLLPLEAHDIAPEEVAEIYEDIVRTMFYEGLDPEDFHIRMPGEEDERRDAAGSCAVSYF